MKKIFVLLLGQFLSLSAFATVDGHTRVFLVVKDIQSGEFFVERAPIIGCYGIVQGPQLSQFVAPYLVTTNIGCGGVIGQENINALSCAKVVSSKESSDFTSIEEITLDISKCEDKDNSKFITMVRTAAKYNFPQKKGEVKLVLTK